MTPSRKLDPYLVSALHNLPGGGGNLAFRNLKRGVNLGLPSGQDVAKHMKVKNPLTPAEIASDCDGSTDGAVAKQQGLDTTTPLWYYILKEAKVRQWRAPRSGRLDHRVGSLRRPRPWRPQFLPVEGEELEADAAVGVAGRLHFRGSAALRG